MRLGFLATAALLMVIGTSAAQVNPGRPGRPVMPRPGFPANPARPNVPGFTPPSPPPFTPPNIPTPPPITPPVVPSAPGTPGGFPAMPTVQPPPIPNIQPPPIPSFPGANPGTPGQPFGPGQPIIQKQCLKCKQVVSDNAKVGDRCPHCGVVWGYEQDLNGNVTDSKFGNPLALKVIGLLVGVGVVIAIVVKVIQSHM